MTSVMEESAETQVEASGAKLLESYVERDDKIFVHYGPLEITKDRAFKDAPRASRLPVSSTRGMDGIESPIHISGLVDSIKPGDCCHPRIMM